MDNYDIVYLPSCSCWEPVWKPQKALNGPDTLYFVVKSDYEVVKRMPWMAEGDCGIGSWEFDWEQCPVCLAKSKPNKYYIGKEIRITPTDPIVTQYIGSRGKCSKGFIGTITGIAKMPWGIAFVGITDDGKFWSSTNPTIIE